MCIRVIVLLTLIFHQQAIASDFGTTGLIDIPTARMANDGMLTTNAVSQSRSKSTSITYQVTPWLEGTFRYTGINDIANFWDRNFEFKARLLKEKNYLPQIAIGIRDVTGTGYWGSEYLVASKEIGNLDLTLGMGWGRLAGDGDIKNPLINISEKFAARNNPFGLGGKLSTDAFFRGPEVGFFGGISYKLTKLPITLMVEYNPDEYLAEIQSGAPEPESPISTAIRWDISNNISTTLSYQHMQEWGIRLSAAFDTKTPPDKPSKPMFTSSLNLNQNQLRYLNARLR